MSWVPQASGAARGLSGLASGTAGYNPGGYGGALSSLGNYAGGAGNALGVLGGVEQGGIGGYGRAGVSAAQLANRAGAFGGASSTAGQTIGDAANVLGIYSGLKQGGVGGYGGAAVNAAQLGSRLGAFGGASGAVGTAAGYAAIPLALYNEINNWQSGATGADALGGAETGAAIGTAIMPGVGTLIGGALGGVGGALSSAFGPGKVDPENQNFQGYTQAYNKALQQGGQQAANQVAASDTDPYLALAGYFDLRPNQLKGQNPIYTDYGRMGEQKFTNDLVSQISNAQKSGVIKPGENPAQAYNDVVAPWINSMGTWQDSNKQAMQGALEQMTAQDLSGQAGQDWKAIGGDSPFASLSPQQTPTQASIPMARAGQRTMQAADGGAVSAKLRKLYEGSFKDRVKHFDTGGYNSYVSYPSASAPSSNFNFSLPGADAPASGTNASGVPTDIAAPDNSGAYGMGYYNPAAPYTDTSPGAGGSGGGGGSGSGSILGQGGALSGLGSLLGVSSMGQLLQQYGALAPLLSAALGANKPASAPATPAGYSAIPSIATPTNTRSYTQPNVANWYTYGQGPEQSFFNNNQLPSVPGVSPSAAPAPTTSPSSSVGPGGMNTQPILLPQTGLQRPVMAAGGSFDSTQGDDYVPDPGHGDGTSDGIDAKLSGGEYVMDAGTVSTLGNGSNEAGARALDQLRARVRKHAGKQLVKGKQFMKAKPPQAYLGGKGE